MNKKYQEFEQMKPENSGEIIYDDNDKKRLTQIIEEQKEEPRFEGKDFSDKDVMEELKRAAIWKLEDEKNDELREKIKEKYYGKSSEEKYYEKLSDKELLEEYSKEKFIQDDELETFKNYIKEIGPTARTAFENPINIPFIPRKEVSFRIRILERLLKEKNIPYEKSRTNDLNLYSEEDSEEE